MFIDYRLHVAVMLGGSFFLFLSSQTYSEINPMYVIILIFFFVRCRHFMFICVCMIVLS